MKNTLLMHQLKFLTAFFFFIGIYTSTQVDIYSIH